METVLFQTIQFSVSTQFSSIWPINRALSGAITQSQSWPGNDGIKGVLHIPQSSGIIETSASDFLVSYIRTLVVVVGGLTPLQRCSWFILQPQPTGK